MLRILGRILETVLNFCEDTPEWLDLQRMRFRAWESRHYRITWLIAALAGNIGLYCTIILAGQTLRGQGASPPWALIAAIIITAIAYLYVAAWSYRLLHDEFVLPLRVDYNPFTNYPELWRANGRDKNGKPFWGKPSQEKAP